MTSRRMTLALGAFFLCAASVVAADSAKGTFTVNGTKFNLRNAYATWRPDPFEKTKKDVFIIVTDKELPAGALFDEFALMDLTDKGISGISIEVDSDKRVNSGTLFSPAFKKMHQFSSTGKQVLETKTWTKDHVTGTVSMPADDFFGEKYEFSTSFDAPIQTKPPEKPVVLSGKPLPAGGGEPAKAWEAYRKAITSGDMNAIRKSVTADMVKQTNDPDFKKMLGLIQAMQPKHVKVVRGAVDGDTATLLVDDLDEKNSKGTITLIREGGQWKMQREDWKNH